MQPNYVPGVVCSCCSPYSPIPPSSTGKKRCETAFPSIFRVKTRAPRLRGKGPRGKKKHDPVNLKKDDYHRADFRENHFHRMGACGLI